MRYANFQYKTPTKENLLFYLITKKSQKRPEIFPQNPQKENPKNLQKSPFHIFGSMNLSIINDLKRKNNWYFYAVFNFKHFILFQYYFWSNYWGVRYANFQYKTPTKENLLFYLICYWQNFGKSLPFSIRKYHSKIIFEKLKFKAFFGLKWPGLKWPRAQITERLIWPKAHLSEGSIDRGSNDRGSNGKGSIDQSPAEF